MENHKYLKLIEYAMSQSGKTYHMQAGLNAAKLTESDFIAIRDSIFLPEPHGYTPPGVHQTHDWRLRPEAVFGYLSYKQYEHAKASTKKALMAAWAAVGITFLGSIATLVLA